MEIVKSFIINNVFYLNIMLPLQHIKAPIMKLYKLQSHYMPANISEQIHTLSRTLIIHL